MTGCGNVSHTLVTEVCTLPTKIRFILMDCGCNIERRCSKNSPCYSMRIQAKYSLQLVCTLRICFGAEKNIWYWTVLFPLHRLDISYPEIGDASLGVH